MNAVTLIHHAMASAAAFGHRSMDDGTELFGHIPHVAPEAYLHVLFSPLDHAARNQMEARIGRQLHRDLKHLYGQCNGLRLFNGALAIFGMSEGPTDRATLVAVPFDIIVPNTVERPPLGDDIATFGAYNWDGSQVGMRYGDDSVLRYDRRDGRMLTTWPTFDCWLSKELARLANLFDSTGRKIDERQPTCPEPVSD